MVKNICTVLRAANINLRDTLQVCPVNVNVYCWCALNAPAVQCIQGKCNKTCSSQYHLVFQFVFVFLISFNGQFYIGMISYSFKLNCKQREVSQYYAFMSVINNASKKYYGFHSTNELTTR